MKYKVIKDQNQQEKYIIRMEELIIENKHVGSDEDDEIDFILVLLYDFEKRVK